MDDAKAILEDRLVMLNLADAWKRKHEELRQKLETVDPNRMSPDVWDFVERMGEMSQRLPNMLDAINDIVMKRGFDQIVADEFREVLSLL